MKKKPLMIMIAGLIALPIMDLAQAQQVDRSYSRCISLDSKSNSLTAFWINNCNQRLNVSWVDQGSCRNGCSVTVGAGRRESIGDITGSYFLVACPYPKIPTSEWIRGVPYRCR